MTKAILICRDYPSTQFDYYLRDLLQEIYRGVWPRDIEGKVINPANILYLEEIND